MLVSDIVSLFNKFGCKFVRVSLDLVAHLWAVRVIANFEPEALKSYANLHRSQH